jgi:hypothetical protein
MNMPAQGWPLYPAASPKGLWLLLRVVVPSHRSASAMTSRACVSFVIHIT